MQLLSLFLLIVLPLFPKGFTVYKNDFVNNQIQPKQTDFQQRSKELDKYYSKKKMGAFVEDGQTIFRLFAPQAVKVLLCTFTSPEDTNGKEYLMTKDDDGVWEIGIWGEKYGLYYGFKVYHSTDDPSANKILCLDPYAKAVTTFNTYLNPRLGIVIKEGDYDWEGDSWIQLDWEDLIIYEMHIRDMTIHPSSGVKQPGTYMGLTEKNTPGGLDYIKSLGVNAVELLPAMEFANIELPYKKDSLLGRVNTWNPYERNHWGYMTAAFFAPEAFYAENTKEFTWNIWEGKDAKQVKAFKDMVKAFHKEGIAVIMDVVYNHLSEYEFGNLKEIDKEYYFRLDEHGNFIAQSGCGNDLKTERPMMRKLIIESVIYWMKEYHIDGFRFDLGKLLDWITIEEIIREAKKINPDVIFVCEPWGGGYDPMGFSIRGWAAWNDQIRNGVKGENPFDGLGWLFGKWYGNNSPERIKSYVNGTLTKSRFGLFLKKEHSVNYLESHDGYTLGDFIRIGLGDASPDTIIKNIDSFVTLTPEQLKLHKLGALFLLTSRGIPMLHAGQEFARTKVIPYNISVPDNNKGKIDRDTYNKDNEANYINYHHAEINAELVEYYRGLIAIRNSYDAFRKADYEDVNFFDIKDNEFAMGYILKYDGSVFAVLTNANRKKSQDFVLPEGNWDVLANAEKAGLKPLVRVKGNMKIPPSSGAILKLAD